MDSDILKQRARAFDYLFDSVVVTDLRGIIIDWNTGSETLYGYSKEEAIGQPVNILHVPDDSEQITSEVILAVEKFGKWSGEIRMLHKDGCIGWVESMCVPFYDENDQMVGALGINRDITDRKQKEKEKEALVQSLHIAVEQSQQASKAKSLFLASMSHEIRTPMNGIFGMLQVLRGTTLNEEQQHYIETLESCSKNLLLLIDDLLDLSRIESGKLVLNIEPFETFGWVTNIQNIAEPLFVNNKTAFITEVSSDLPTYLEGDEARLLQIIANLLSNSAKFTPDGEVKLTIGGQLITENQFNLQISVKDTGMGIADEKLGFIFDDFNQIELDNIVNKGVGLGLSICKRLTDIMGGCLQVTSELGKGCCFTFSTTLSVPKESYHLKDADEESKINRKLSIMVVDDDAINLLLVRKLLEGVGHSVIEAENGQVAIKKAKSGSFDVILMDVHMPVMGGISATQKIRKENNKYKLVPIIGLTASVMNNEKDFYLRAGMNAVVEKPIIIEKLMKTIQQLL